MKSESIRVCSLCSQDLYSIKSISVDENILELFNFLINEINTLVFWNSEICEPCLENIKKACGLKSLYLENSCDEKVQQLEIESVNTICRICKDFVNPHIHESLVNTLLETNMTNVIEYLIPNSKLANFQTCETCKNTIINLNDMLKLLSLYDQNKRYSDDLKEEKVLKKEKLDGAEINEGLIPLTFRDSSNESVKIASEKAASCSNFLENIKDETDSLLTNNIIENQNIYAVDSTLHLIKNEKVAIELEDINEKGKAASTSLQNEETNFKKETNTFEVEKVQDEEKAVSKEPTHQIEEKVFKVENVDSIEINEGNIPLDFNLSVASMNNKVNTSKTDDEKERSQELPCQLLQQSDNSQLQDDAKLNNQIDTNEQKTQNKRSKKQRKPVYKNSGTGKWYRCTHCSYKSRYNQVLGRHMKRHRAPDEIEWFMCHVCNAKFKDKYGFRDHVRIHSNPNDVKWQCPHCPFYLSKGQYLKQKLPLDDLDQTEKYKCQLCNYVSSRKRGTAIHMEYHKNEHLRIHNPNIKIYKCDKCDFQTKVRKGFKVHFHLQHTDPKYLKFFKCFHCSFQTKKKGHLIIHLLRHRTPHESELLKCTHCSYNTLNKYNLKRHMLNHMPEKIKWHKCTLCPYTAKRPSLLKSHFQSKHENS